jgi:hypothetical protein
MPAVLETGNIFNVIIILLGKKRSRKQARKQQTEQNQLSQKRITVAHSFYL